MFRRMKTWIRDHVTFDVTVLAGQIALNLALSYVSLHEFMSPFSPEGSESWYPHGMAVTTDAAWVYAITRLARGRCDTKKKLWTTRTLFYFALGVSVAASAIAGYMQNGPVGAVVRVLPAALLVLQEITFTQDFVSTPKLTVTKSFGTPTGKPTNGTGSNLVDISNDIIAKVRSGERRPGWNSVSKTYGLKQGEARRVVSMVKGAITDAA